MTVIHALTPAPRRGAPDDAGLPAVPPGSTGTASTGTASTGTASTGRRSDATADVLAAARTLAAAADAAHTAGSPEPCHGASALATGPACARAVECERAGVITVVTEHDTTHLCGMHAMTAVFTTPGLLALVKPDGV